MDSSEFDTDTEKRTNEVSQTKNDKPSVLTT